MFHKEYIRDQMLKEVARTWNMEGYVNEDSFDPLVNMLINALASESELVYKEINRSQERVAGSLLSKLIPYENKGVQPGHTMVLLNPSEQFVDLPEHTKLRTQLRTDDQMLKDIHLLTCSKVSLFVGGVSALYSKTNSYDIVDFRFKVEKENTDNKLNDKEIKIDVEYQGQSMDLESVPLFFDLRLSGEEKKQFFEKLARASFCIDGTPVRVFKRQTEEFLVAETYNPLVNLENAVLDFYKHQYIELEIPECLKSIEGFRKGKEEGSGVFSITIDLGSYVSPDVIRELFCYVNVVPVVNIQEHNRILKAGNDFSVFHLSQADPFYNIKTIYSDEGKVYRKYEGGRNGVDNEGTYLIRKDEVEGLSEKGAGEIIDYLTGIMRNENAVLSNLTSANFSNDLKVLKQITSRLEQAMGDRKSSDDSTYLFLKDDDEPDFVFVDYYSTKGSEVKGIKVNSPLFVADGSMIRQNGNYILTPLTGGRNALKEDEFLYEVRHSMLSGGRIVTKRDVASLVQRYYGDKIEHLVIQKGMMECTDLNRGYTRTLDILLTIKGQISIEDSLALGKLLLCEIEENGSDVYPYRLFVDDTEIIK